MPKVVDKELDAELAQQMQDAESGNNNVDGPDDASALQPAAAQQEPAKDAAKDEAKEPDEPAAKGEPDEPDAPAQQQGIPKRRFDAVNDRRKAAERQARQLEEQLEALKAAQGGAPAPNTGAPAPSPGADEQLLRQQLAQATHDSVAATVEGDTDRAVEAQMKVADITGQIAALRAPAPVSTDDAVAQVNYNHALADVKINHPQLDDSSKYYDEGAVIEVNDLFEGLVHAGKPLDEALRKAVSYVMPESPGMPKGPAAADTQRNIANAQAAAPNIAQAGQADSSNQRINWAALSDEDWAAIPESKKKEARGDFLT